MSSPAQADVVHFQPDGGINDAYLVNQLPATASHRQPGFITSVPGGTSNCSAGRAGTFVKLNYLDGGGSERTGLAVSTGADDPIISIAPRPTAVRRWIWKTTT